MRTMSVVCYAPFVNFVLPCSALRIATFAAVEADLWIVKLDNGKSGVFAAASEHLIVAMCLASRKDFVERSIQNTEATSVMVKWLDSAPFYVKLLARAWPRMHSHS